MLYHLTNSRDIKGLVYMYIHMIKCNETRRHLSHEIQGNIDIFLNILSNHYQLATKVTILKKIEKYTV